MTPFTDMVSQPAHTNGEINHVFDSNNWAAHEYEMTKKLSSEEQKQKSFKFSLDGFNGTDHVVSLNLDLKLPGPIVNDHVSEPGTDSLMHTVSSCRVQRWVKPKFRSRRQMVLTFRLGRLRFTESQTVAAAVNTVAKLP